MEFSWRRILKAAGAIVAVGAFIGAGYAAAMSRPARIAWASLAQNRKELDLDCEHLPFYAQVEKAFDRHQDLVARVKAVAGVTDFKAEELRCRNYDGGLEFIKGDAVLSYTSRAARSQAEAIIGRDFYGIGYRGYESRNR